MIVPEAHPSCLFVSFELCIRDMFYVLFSAIEDYFSSDDLFSDSGF